MQVMLGSVLYLRVVSLPSRAGTALAGRSAPRLFRTKLWRRQSARTAERTTKPGITQAWSLVLVAKGRTILGRISRSMRADGRSVSGLACHPST